MGASKKTVVCRLSDMDHTIIGAAAAASGLTIESYLQQAAIQVAHAMGIPRPYQFAGQLFGTNGLPDDWYEASSEEELIEHLKMALRQRDVDAACAMAVELLDFPATWAELEYKERGFGADSDILSFIDVELIELVNGTIGGTIGQIDLGHDTPAWSCYKALLRRAQDPRGQSSQPWGSC